MVCGLRRKNGLASVERGRFYLHGLCRQKSARAAPLRHKAEVVKPRVLIALFHVTPIFYQIQARTVNVATSRCWPKFKTGILERSKLESFGRSKLDARPTVNVDADQSTVQALSLHIQSQSRIPFLSTVRAMLRRLARQLARPVAPGIATVAAPKSTRRDEPFPSA